MARIKIAVRLLDGEKLPEPIAGNELTRRAHPSNQTDLEEMTKMGLGDISPEGIGRLFFSQVTSMTGTGWIERLPGIELLGSRELTPA